VISSKASSGKVGKRRQVSWSPDTRCLPLPAVSTLHFIESTTARASSRPLFDNSFCLLPGEFSQTMSLLGLLMNAFGGLPHLLGELLGPRQNALEQGFLGTRSPPHRHNLYPFAPKTQTPLSGRGSPGSFNSSWGISFADRIRNKGAKDPFEGLRTRSRIKLT
jgi:hypothetical protein